MNTALKNEQMALAAERFRRRQARRERNCETIHKGQLWKADDPRRVQKWLRRRGVDAHEARGLIAAKTPDEQRAVVGEQRFRVLERQIGRNDQMSIAFLEAGMIAARAVGRVLVDLSFGSPAEYGTGFLVSPRLLLTNHHVLESATVAGNSSVEFSYEQDVTGQMKRAVTFQLKPDYFFFNDKHLDYALVSVAESNADGAALRDQGWNPLISEQGKAITAQWVNIIQHPGGGPKQLVLRENQIVDVYPDDEPEFISYLADTEGGSSGSPVFNDRWEVIALHHAGIYKRDDSGRPLTKDGRLWTSAMGEDAMVWLANEGVRMTKIIEHLHTREMTTAERAFLSEAFMPPIRPTSGAEYHPLDTTMTPPMNSNTSRSISIVLPSEPCEITIRIGAVGTPASGPATTGSVTPPALSGPSGGAPLPVTDEQMVLEAARQEFAKYSGVLGVRLGYKYVNDWITNQRAIVVIVRQRLSPNELTDLGRNPLPSQFLEWPVEKENAGITDLLAEHLRVRSAADPSESLRSRLDDMALESRYAKPPGLTLPRLEKQTMTVLAHAGPDASWPVLRDFLAGARKTLTIAMYDFTAPHILEALKTACKKKNFKKLRLCIQAGESLGNGVKADDRPDSEIVKELAAALKKKFEVAWVTVDSAKKSIEGWVAHDYHIKVAVRDGKAFWLSSGNWQSSNQPDASPYTDNPPVAQWLSKHNREWHVVVEHPGLAKVFEDYINYDFQNNTAPTPEEALGTGILLPDVLVPDDFFRIDAFEAARKIQYFAPEKFTGKTTVQPLLTPDNYMEHAIPLVQSATQELLIENQSFSAPAPTAKTDIAKLMNAVLDRQRHGVKVRVIFRRIGEYRRSLDSMKKFGFDTDDVRLQTGCHTKGIIVDGKKVLIGSHNITGLGITRNRDASLLFEDQRIAGYFKDLFEYDWKNRASASAPQPHFAPEIADESTTVRRGFIRLKPKDYLPWI